MDNGALSQTGSRQQLNYTNSDWHTRILAENMCDLVCLLNRDGNLRYVSPSAQGLLDYSPEELVGTSFFDLIYPEELICVREEFAARLNSDETDFRIDYRIRRKTDDYRWVETTFRNIESDGEIPAQILSVSRDATERKNAERERLAAQEEIARLYFDQKTSRAEAEAAHREADIANRAKDEFLQLISHEFRTPLTTIKTLARIMQQGGETLEERNEYLETIVAECSRQIDMILNLLDIARVDESHIDFLSAPTDINRVLKTCEKIERHAANARNQTFTVETDDSLPLVATDEKALRRALCSIIENAIKYTPVGGKITVSAELLTHISDEKETVSLGTELAAGFQPSKEIHKNTEKIAVKISDTGRGIHAEDIPELFQKFFRGRRVVPHDQTTDGTPDDVMGRAETPGVGLGLYLSKRLITKLGGQINVKSEVGRGSCFTVFLPLWKDEDSENNSQDKISSN